MGCPSSWLKVVRRSNRLHGDVGRLLGRAMMPASGSDGSCWSKVAEMQQLRMPPHERQWSTTLLALSRSRTPPSRSQHLHSCTLEDRVGARISLLGCGCGALGAERGNKTSERLFRPFCPLLEPPRFRTSPA